MNLKVSQYPAISLMIREPTIFVKLIYDDDRNITTCKKKQINNHKFWRSVHYEKTKNLTKGHGMWSGCCC